MVISHRYKFLYFVVPKCASATVRNSLREFTDIGFPVSKYTQRGMKYTEHVTISQFLGSEHAALFQEGYFRFSFVRNPYDRLYSAFQQDLSNMRQTRSWRRWWAKWPIFKTIGEDFNRYITEYVRHADIDNAWDWIHFCPMAAFTHLEGQCMMDYLGRAEDVEGSLTGLSNRLGIQIMKTENRNVRVQPTDGELKYLHKYSREALEVVNELYRDDFEYFGYERIAPEDCDQFTSRKSA